MAEENCVAMKQVLQDLKTGKVTLAEVPVPIPGPSRVLVQTHSSVISSGTERMLLEFGRASMLGKARQQPDKFKQTIEKLSTDGLLVTIDAVRSKLEQPLELGYCNAGTVVEVGSAVSRFRVGERVACNGPHAEFVSVPQNLCVPLAEGVDFESGCFAPIGAVAIQSIRLVAPSLGETVAVIGLGLVGQLAVQLLEAVGCQVIAIDYNEERLDLAGSFGAVPVKAGAGMVARVRELAYDGIVDGVLVATATDDDTPIRNAAEMCRVRGRIVLVGTSGLNLSRQAWFEKELTFQVSRSYGPGRYDEKYESAGEDLPVGNVRWSARRNLSSFINLLAEKQLDLGKLVSGRFDVSEAEKAYDVLTNDRSALAIVLRYRQEAIPTKARSIELLDSSPTNGAPNRSADFQFDVIGAGNYGSRILLPALKRCGVRLGILVNTGGVSAAHHGRRFGFACASSEIDAALRSDSGAVFIVTRHDTHAELTQKAIQAGKSVYVEKPLAVTAEQLDSLRSMCTEAGEHHPCIMVGFNRRFAPIVVRMKELLKDRSEPATFVYTVNAGVIAEGHWVLDPEIGGGRIIGEVCHFIDVIRHLSGQQTVAASVIGSSRDRHPSTQQTVSIGLRMNDGSTATIHYLANGPSGFAKERLEVFCGGAALCLHNFRSLKTYGWRGARDIRSLKQDKGHQASISAFVQAVKNGAPGPIPLQEIFEVSHISILLNQRWQASETGWCSIESVVH